MESKYCKKCNQTKLIESFTRHRKSKDGFYYCCKECKNLGRKPSKRKGSRPKENPITASNRMERFKRNNPGYFSRKSLEWQKQNPDKVKQYKRKRTLVGKDALDSQKRRALISGLLYDFTNEDWGAAIKNFEHSCAYCGVKEQPLQRDHIVSLKNGGPFIPSNIIPACKTCNTSKSDKDMYEWYSEKEFFNLHRYLRILEWVEKTALRNGVKLSENMVTRT
ncbi:HNH endonuclease [Bacillus sp. Gen3]|nr:HNH endonuclease [Bacillus sp. Gen3]